MRDGKAFQMLCLAYVQKLAGDKWNVSHEVRVRRRGGEGHIRMDIVLTERKRGGRRIVIECKDYLETELSAVEISQVVAYAQEYRASKAFLFYNSDAAMKDNVRALARKSHVHLVEVDVSTLGQIGRWIRGQFGHPPIEIDLS